MAFIVITQTPASAKMTSDSWSGPGFTNFCSGSWSERNSRILPESTPDPRPPMIDTARTSLPVIFTSAKQKNSRSRSMKAWWRVCSNAAGAKPRNLVLISELFWFEYWTKCHSRFTANVQFVRFSPSTVLVAIATHCPGMLWCIFLSGLLIKRGRQKYFWKNICRYLSHQCARVHGCFLVRKRNRCRCWAAEASVHQRGQRIAHQVRQS